MLSNFNLPSVDHLIEGLHYSEVEYDFAQRCHKGTWRDRKSGACVDKNAILSRRRQHQNNQGSRQTSRSESSNFQNNKKISTGHGDYGWAMKNGKPTLVKWGSVAGIKNEDGTITKTDPE
jgi:Zn-finger nucleic acid-binding protein